MNDRVQLPPAPLTVTRYEQPLEGAGVEAWLMNGESLRGTLQDLDPERGTLHIRTDGEAEPVEIVFDNLRRLSFDTPVSTEQFSGHPLEEHGEVTLPSGTREFRLVYTDGEEWSGRVRNMTIDRAGLHLFWVGDDGLVRRALVPRQVVRNDRVGTRLGERLVSDHHVTAEQVSDAVQAQQTARERKLGEYIASNVAISVDELKHVLQEQSVRPNKRLGELLVAEGHVTEEQLEQALEAQRQDRGKKLGEILEQMGAISSQEVHFTLAQKLGVPFVKLRKFDLDPSVLDAIPAQMARRMYALPLFVYRDRLVVAMDDPTNIETIDMLRFITGRNIEPAIATKEDIEWAIDRHYGPRESEEVAEELDVTESDSSLEQQRERERREAERLGKEKPIVRLVNNILIDAIRRNASDIHIRPLEDQVDLLLRVHGTLIKVRSFGKALLPAVVSRIKIVGRMDIAERRLPQDGRASVVDQGSVVDLRISVIPTVEGESVVIRILNTAAGLKSVGELGFAERDQEEFTDLLHKSYGIMLVTGPTGSGKSTTLYAALQEIQSQNVNIITVEDPVEYHIQGIEQIQVHAAAGYTFAKALRHILRHDPDVIMVGEIRDTETAKIANESALTGHLVLSTLHTNDAASTVTRLIEMGVEPYLVNATLLGVLAQRLVRRNCPHCMEEEQAEPGMRRALQVAEDEVFFRGTGCSECNYTGYTGRLAVYELLKVTPELRALIAEGADADRVHRTAVEQGMVPLTENALVQARQRRISLAEVYRVRLQ